MGKYLTGTTIHFVTDWEQIVPTVRFRWHWKDLIIFPVPCFGVMFSFRKGVDTIPQAISDLFVSAMLLLIMLSSKRLRTRFHDPNHELYDPEWNWWTDEVRATYYRRKLRRCLDVMKVEAKSGT